MITEPATHVQDAPLVSIGLPIYNEERHLAEALDSLLAQDYANIEVVISDNASTDATAEICAAYAARDKRIRYLRNDINIGGMENFNRVVECARGDYFMWASGHDLRHPSFVSRCLAVMRQDTQIVLCHSEAVWIDENGQQLESVASRLDTSQLYDQLSRMQITMWSIVEAFAIYGLVRAKQFKATHLYQPVYSPDVSLLIELSLLGKCAFIPEPLSFARRPEDWGNVEVYVEKHFKGRSKWQMRVLFWRMIWDLCKRTCWHIPGIRGKTAAVLSVVICMLTKYRWMLTNLRSIKRSERAESVNQSI